MFTEIAAFFVGAEVVDLVRSSGLVAQAVLILLLGFSLFSWALIYAKWSFFRKARRQSERFLRSFRKAQKLSDLAPAIEQFQPCPLARVFEAGNRELAQQLSGGGNRITNPAALQRSLQIAAGEQLTHMENMMSWLATTGAVTPFIGLFGTVWGIMDAFHGLGTAGGASIRAVAPGISEALITTAAGLFTAVPAVIFYNLFLHSLREFGSRMDHFALEFLNLAERHYSN